MDELDADFLACRFLQHAWRIVAIERGRQLTAVHLECERCGTTAEDLISTRGFKETGRRYQYAEGYQIKGGVERPDIRVQAMRRFGKRKR